MAMYDEAQARAEVWNYIFGFQKISLVKCVIELGIPDILEKHGAVSLSELSASLDLPPDVLYRIMRFLSYHGIFRKTEPSSGSVCYAQTLLSHLFTRDNMGPFVMLQGVPHNPSGCITAESLRSGGRRGYVSTDSEKMYEDPVTSMKVFRDAMACHARSTTSAIIDNYAQGFEGIRSLVDVGGSYGMALGMLVKAFPWVRGICFDLPGVVAKASPINGIEFVGGSMFENVPKADAVMLMFVLHNWSDEECIDILKKCKEAIPANTGKVMIVDAIVDEDNEGDEYVGARLLLDITMMAVSSKGKERTYKEWNYILKEAGFRRHVVKNIKYVESVIEAYP